MLVTMSALAASTLVARRVTYPAVTLASVSSVTLTFGYCFMNSLSIWVRACTAGGLTQVIILSDPEGPLAWAEAAGTVLPAAMRAATPIAVVAVIRNDMRLVR